MATDLSSLSSDENTMDQLTQTVTAESQTLQQLTTDANNGEAVCYSQLSDQAATLSSNADALDGAAQTVTNDRTQLNRPRDDLSQPRAIGTVESSLSMPLGPATVLDAITAADGDLGEAGAERGSVNLTASSATDNEVASRKC